MNNLSLRLKTIGNLTLKRKSLGIIDVGCDHALLDIYLYLNDSSLNIIASDNKTEPIKRAICNIKKYGLEKKIKTSLSEGISNINEEIDTVIISGMGTENIIDILSHDNLKYINRLIISSNNKYSLLRNKITKFGFKISNEIIIKEGKYYQIIEFIRGNEKYSKEELEYGPILLKEKSEIFIEYYKNILNKLKNILNKIPEGKEKQQTLKKINSIKKIIKFD